MKHKPFQLHDEVEVFSANSKTMTVSWLDATIIGRTLEAEPRYSVKVEGYAVPFVDLPHTDVRKRE
mgnify:CR=1 FL=1|jgi:hypothetical protein